MFFAVNTETIILPNGTATSLNPVVTEYVIIESASQHVDGPTPDTAVQKEEIPATVPSAQEEETSNKDQPDESVPATDPQPVSVFIFKGDIFIFTHCLQIP